MPSAPPPPLGVPFFDQSGTITQPWQWYLYQVAGSANGIRDLAVLEAFDQGPGSSGQGPAEDAQRLALLADAPVVLPAGIEELRTQIALVREPEPGSDRARLDDLERLIWTLTGFTIAPPAAWLPFAPAFAVNAGAATITVQLGFYQQIGRQVFIRASARVNITAGAPVSILFTTPVAAIAMGTGQALTATLFNVFTGLWVANAAQFNAAKTVAISSIPAPLPQAVNLDVAIAGVYEAPA